MAKVKRKSDYSELMDVNISKLPCSLDVKYDITTIRVSTGQHIIYEEEVLTPVITFRYKNLNNKIVAI